jgi:serine/threonine protein kinase
LALIFFFFSALKLIDFGLAIQIDDDEVWENGAGTPYYMAPEIIDNTFRHARTGKVAFLNSMCMSM